MDDKLLLRIDSVINHITKVLNDTKGLTLEDFENNDLLLRATCFSVAQIGEIMNQLEKRLIVKYPELPWISARSMRNVIVYDYDGTDVAEVFVTIENDLPLLKAAFLKIKSDITNL